jgi:hypothetical protein
LTTAAHYLARVVTYWRPDIAKGQRVFEAQPDPLAWAVGVLEAVCQVTRVDLPQVQEAIAVARDPGRWHEGHDAFDRLRVDSVGMAGIESDVMGFAELIAKLAYNATDPDDEFDDDTGWWVEPSALRIADIVGGRTAILRALGD